MNKSYLFFLLASLILLYGCQNDADFVSICTQSPNPVSLEEGSSEMPEETVYYWYKGAKIYIHTDTSTEYVVKKYATNHNLRTKSSNQFSNGGELQENKIRMSWTISDRESKNTTRSNEEILYSSPSYTTKEGKQFSISHLFYVKLKQEKDSLVLQELTKKHNLTIIDHNKYLPLWWTISCANGSGQNSLDIANAFYETGLFEAAEPEIMEDLSQSTTPYQTPNDPLYSNQWNLKGLYGINLSNSHSITEGNGIKLAIIDEGIDIFHPDLNFTSGLPGIDLIENNWDTPQLVRGNHGTACAGIICAQTNNNEGIVGIAPKISLYSYSVSLQVHPNIIKELSNGLILASQNADVISCSWGGEVIRSTLIEDALSLYCFQWGRDGKGCIVVFSSGNDNSNVNFPANCNENIITVGASDNNGNKCSFSNFGPELDVVAPGVKIPTTDLVGKNGYSNDNYTLEFDGTSAACPHVAATAALMLAINNNLTSKEVSNIIESTVRKVGGYTYTNKSDRKNGSWCQEMGYGLINTYEAVLEAKYY